jgi:hypothetical protein
MLLCLVHHCSLADKTKRFSKEKFNNFISAAIVNRAIRRFSADPIARLAGNEMDIQCSLDAVGRWRLSRRPRYLGKPVGVITS